VSSTLLLSEFAVFVIAAFLGFELITRVPSLLHTPLMSATNAIHGIVLVGAILALAAPGDTFTRVIGFIAVVFGSMNVMGGYWVTNRMLEMFRARPARRRRRPR